MTRRKSLLALGALTGALTNQAAEAQSTTTGTLTFRDGLKPTPLKFNLRAFSRYDFTLDGDTVSFTPEQLMAGLRPCQHESAQDAWGANFSFEANGIKGWPCRKCGLWIWEKKR